VEVGTAIPAEEMRDYARRFRGVGQGSGVFRSYPGLCEM
jgi:hypothetical protein